MKKEELFKMHGFLKPEKISSEYERFLYSSCTSLAFLEADTSVLRLVKDYLDNQLIGLAWYTLQQYSDQLQKVKGVTIEKPKLKKEVTLPVVGKVVEQVFVVAKAFNADRALLKALKEVDHKQIQIWNGKKEKQIYKLLVQAETADLSSDVYEVYIKPEVKPVKGGYELCMKEESGETLLLGTFPNMKLAKLFFKLLKEHNEKLMQE